MLFVVDILDLLTLALLLLLALGWLIVAGIRYLIDVLPWT